jgi:hypothetical protein
LIVCGSQGVAFEIASMRGQPPPAESVGSAIANMPPAFAPPPSTFGAEF